MRALSGGPEGVKSKHFIRKSVKGTKFHKMCHASEVKSLAWKVNKVQI